MAKAKGKRAAKAPKKAADQVNELPEDMYDEVDDFHKQKDKVMLDGSVSASEEDSEDDMGVYDLADESESEDNDDRLEQLEQQEKALRAKLQMQKGEESTDEEDEESEEDDIAPGKWGKRKGDYYAEGEIEDEEDLAAEEAEAKRLQNAAAQRLSKSDFGLESDDEDEEDDGEDVDTLERQIEREELGPRKQAAEPSTAADAEEYEALLATFKTALEEVRSRVGPLLKEVKEGKLATAEGLSYLETKNHLLLQYIMHLIFYFLLRAEGKPVNAHPVISRLVEIRTFLEKIRPIDKKLQYQVNKLLSSQQLVKANAENLEEAEMDPLQFRPNPQALVPKVTANGAQEGDTEGVYRPPRLNPVAMGDDPDKDTNKRKRRAAEERVRQSGRSQMISELAREVMDAPDEIKGARVEGDDSYAARQREKLLRRAAEEEELMMRVPLAKKELKGLRAAQHKAGFSGGAMLDDFADDVADLVKATSQLEGGGRLSQRFGADLSQQQAGQARASGDADLPGRASLAVRRAHVDNAKAHKKRPELDSDEEPDEMSLLPKSKKGRTMAPEANELYEDAARKAESRKAAKLAKYKAPSSAAVPLEDEIEEGHRKLNRAVEKNRGLTPHRRKDAKNPRVKGRKKFEKATIRRRGQVQAPRSQAGPYGGEQSGIKAGVSKSTRF